MCEYYEINAEQYAADTFGADLSEQYGKFLPLLPGQAKILDLGSGSGRDTCFFSKNGYRVTALEPSKKLCREIRKVFDGEIVCANIQSYQPEERFDGIWACASLIHLTEKELLWFFEHIGQYLKEDGVLYLSGKNGILTGETADGRFFLEFTEALMERILAGNKQMTLEQIWYTTDAGGRKGFRWLNAIFRISKIPASPES